MRCGRLPLAGLAVAACGLQLGCANGLELRTLATGRADVSAYELIGTDLAALRREAQRLCPQGGQIVRQAALDQSPESLGGPLRGWINGASAWIDPPQRSAQMTVVCREAAGQDRLQAAAPASGALAAPQAEQAAAVPVGPLNIEW